jgi:SAM-dependent methyltransferase
LLGPKQLALWRSYFSNDHVLYAVNNRVGAVALERWLRPGANTILELGAGMGSGTAAALAQVAGAGRLGDVGSYRVTELVPTFLRFAQRHVDERFAGLPGLTFGALDMNQPFAPQGVAPRSVSVVYAVNTLHVARDLAATLGEIHAALEPGGQLVFAECVRPADGQTLYPEFVFNMLATFRARGFLTPGQWTKALDAAGFVDVRIFPDVARIHEAVPGFCLGAIGATRP